MRVSIAIQREEEKVKRSLKDAAKKGDKDVCRILAKEVVRAKKSVNKINAAKAQLKSVEYNMNQQLGWSRHCHLSSFTCWNYLYRTVKYCVMLPNQIKSFEVYCQDHKYR